MMMKTLVDMGKMRMEMIAPVVVMMVWNSRDMSLWNLIIMMRLLLG